MNSIDNNASNTSRIYAKLKKGATGAIAFYRVEFSHAENLKRQRSLYAKLITKTNTFSVTTIHGSYIETMDSVDHDELATVTFFVSQKYDGNDNGRLKDILVSLGKEFDQESVLSMPFEGAAQIIGTTHREKSSPKFDEALTIDSFSFGKASEYLDKINKRLFVIADIQDPANWLGRWGLSKAAKKDWRDL